MIKVAVINCSICWHVCMRACLHILCVLNIFRVRAEQETYIMFQGRVITLDFFINIYFGFIAFEGSTFTRIFIITTSGVKCCVAALKSHPATAQCCYIFMLQHKKKWYFFHFNTLIERENKKKIYRITLNGITYSRM